MDLIEKKTWFWRKYCLVLIFILFACAIAYRPSKSMLKMMQESTCTDVTVRDAELSALQEECARLEEELGVAEQ